MPISNNATKEGCRLTELRLEISRLKEEIRCAFARVRHALNSRETSLLDQVDSVKEAGTSLLIAQQLSMTRVESKLEECARYLRLSEEQGNAAGIHCMENMMEDLRDQTKECQSQLEAPLSQVKFVHNSSHMRNAVLSYGKLETDFEEMSSERSWDLVQKEDVSESVVSFEKKGCQSSSCCKEAKEIEDMEFACVQSDDDGSDFENIDLSQVCKANEICTTRSDCVCDEPCYGKQAKKYHTEKSSLSHERSSAIRNLCEENGEKPQNREVNVMRQITDSVGQLLLSPKNKSVNDSDCMDYLQSKIQGILNGTAKETKKLAETMEDCEAMANERFHTGGTTVIDNLHYRLQSLLDQSGNSTSSISHKDLLDKDSTSLAKPDNCATLSLICDLNARLQEILDGSIEPDVDKMESTDPTMMNKQMSFDKSAYKPTDCMKENLYSILHGKIKAILENDITDNEKVDDMAEVPEIVEQDPLFDLHKRIVHILENDNALEPEAKGSALMYESDESLDPISMLSSRMQSLISG